MLAAVGACVSFLAWQAHDKIQALESRLDNVSGRLAVKVASAPPVVESPSLVGRSALLRTMDRRPSPRRHGSVAADAGMPTPDEPELSDAEGAYQADLTQVVDRAQRQQGYLSKARELDERRLAGTPDPAMLSVVTSVLKESELHIVDSANNGCSSELCGFTLEVEGSLRSMNVKINRISEAGEFASAEMMRLPNGDVRLFALRH